MVSSSTASTTPPVAETASTSRICAACATARAAACNDASRSLASCPAITEKSATPSTASTTAKVPTYHAVSCRRSRRSARALAGAAISPRAAMPPRSEAKAIPGPAHGVDQLRLELVVDLPPQSADEDFHHVGGGIVIVIPHVSRDRRPVRDRALMLGEELEQRKLSRGECHRAPPAAPAPRRETPVETRDLQPLRHDRRPPPPEGAHAREQLAKREWL